MVINLPLYSSLNTNPIKGWTGKFNTFKAPLLWIIPVSSLFKLTKLYDPIALHELWGTTVSLRSNISDWCFMGYCI